MNLPQFCQVAMLPQGRFQAFLRARSEERHALLQQVFRTGRFDQVERWLRDHRVSVRRTSEQHAAAVSALVSRVSETADRPVPDEDAAPAGLRAWLDEVRAGARARAYAAAIGRAPSPTTRPAGPSASSRTPSGCASSRPPTPRPRPWWPPTTPRRTRPRRTRVERAERAAALTGLDDALARGRGAA